MDREYLPGDVRDRISDLSKEYGIGQNEIARRIGMSQGAFSRFMSGFTDKLSTSMSSRLQTCLAFLQIFCWAS